MGGLSLLEPKGLLLLAGLAPLVVLYILKIKRQRVRVPSTWLWGTARRDLMAKQPFKRLVPELPLLLQILALVALAVALARPSTRGGRIAGDHVAIVIDTSASMGTLGDDGKTTRLDEAKRAAVSVIGSLEPGADAVVLEAAREARVLTPLERDAQHLRAAVNGVEVREVEGDLASAVALAADRLRSLGGRRRIVVVTDGALAHDTPIVAAGMDAQVITVGAPAANAAIVRLDVRSGTEPTTHKDQVQVFALVENYDKRPRDAFLTLTLDGQHEPLASRRVLVPPEDKAPVVLTFEPDKTAEGMGLVLQLSPGDALPVDDTAYGRVPAGHRMPVTLASSSSYSWMTRALESDPDVDLQKLTLDQLAKVNVDPTALVVVEGACPTEIPGRDVVVIGPPAGRCLGLDVAAPVEQPQLTSWENGDPRLRFLTLDGVHVVKATPIAAQGAGASLVRAGTATLVADASTPGRTATVVGFDVGESDWPLKASFVLFVRNLVEVAKLHRAQGASAPVRTGDPLRIAVPSGVTSVHATGPGMADHELAAKGGFVVVPGIERAGLYRVRWTSPRIGDVAVAANLTSDRESDVRARPVHIEAAGGAAPVAANVQNAHNEWGTWLALLATLVLAFDVYWLTRRARPSVLLGAPATRGAADAKTAATAKSPRGAP